MPTAESAVGRLRILSLPAPDPRDSGYGIAGHCGWRVGRRSAVAAACAGARGRRSCMRSRCVAHARHCSLVEHAAHVHEHHQLALEQLAARAAELRRDALDLRAAHLRRDRARRAARSAASRLAFGVDQVVRGAAEDLVEPVLLLAGQLELAARSPDAATTCRAAAAALRRSTAQASSATAIEDVFMTGLRSSTHDSQATIEW